MKKFNIFILILVISLLNFNVYADGNDSYETVADDDFQNYKIGDIPEGWRCDYDKASGNYIEVTADPKDSSNKCLGVFSNGGAGIVFAYRDIKPVSGMVKIKYRYYIHGSPSAVQYNGRMLGVFATQSYKRGYTYVINGTTAYVIPNFVEPYDTWHEFEGTFDFDERKYTIHVDGEIMVENVNFNDMNVEMADYINWGCADAGEFVLVDDLKVDFQKSDKINYTKLKTSYTYNAAYGTIFNLPADITKDEFYKQCEFVDGAVVDIYDSLGVSVWNKNYIEDGCILKIKAPDGTAEISVTLNVASWNTSSEIVKAGAKCIAFYDEQPKVIVKNKARYINDFYPDIAVYEKDGELYIPVRMTCEAFGYTVGYDAEKTLPYIMKNSERVYVNNAENNSGITFAPYTYLADLADISVIARNSNMLILGEKTLKIPDRIYGEFVNDFLRRSGVSK